MNAPAPDSDGGGTAIRICGLVNRFGEHAVHDGLDLEVRCGEILGVVGGSGTGKSVLMRSIIGLQRPAAGTIEVLGQEIASFDDGAAVAQDGSDIRSRWGVLFQGGALFSTLTVAENIAVPLGEFYPEITPDLVAEIADYKIMLSGLPEDAGVKYPSELSGGMRKRAGLARALALDPELLFLDEPTAGLDPIGAAGFDRLIKALHETLDLTVFLITHDLDTLYAICDRVAVIADKQVIAVGTIDELIETDHPWIKEYFLGPRGRAAAAGREAGRAAAAGEDDERAADAATSGPAGGAERETAGPDVAPGDAAPGAHADVAAPGQRDDAAAQGNDQPSAAARGVDPPAASRGTDPSAASRGVDTSAASRGMDKPESQGA